MTKSTRRSRASATTSSPRQHQRKSQSTRSSSRMPVLVISERRTRAKQNNHSIRCHIQMSALLLKLAGDATVRGTTTHDGMQVFSVCDFINLACQKNGTYSRQLCFRLISNGSNFKDELEGLVYSVTLRNAVNNQSYDTPAKTLQGCSHSRMTNPSLDHAHCCTRFSSTSHTPALRLHLHASGRERPRARRSSVYTSL